MQRDHEHARVVDEQVLRPVAVMDVPVEDADALDTRGERRMRRDRGRVRQAEPHRSCRPGVVTGRSHGAEDRRRASLEHRCDAVARRTCGKPGRPERSRTRPGVRVEPATDGRSPLERSEIRRRVYPLELVRGRLARLSLGDTGADGADTRERRGEASGRLGMAAGRGMLRACGVGQDENGHPCILAEM